MKASIPKRLLASFFDVFIASLLVYILKWVPFIGEYVGVIYLIFRDGINIKPIDYRSIGKYIFGLRPIAVSGGVFSLEESLVRNWIFLLPSIPNLLSGVFYEYMDAPFASMVVLSLLALFGLSVVAYEIYLIVYSEEQRRWGDKLASTEVVDDGDGLI